MGLEPGTAEVASYLDLVAAQRDQAPPALDVLRWWFTLKYDALHATHNRDAFELRGQGVQVLSENEWLDQLGQAQHTGRSDPLNSEFAQRFTQHFAALSQKYPVYADLANICDLALVSALIEEEHLDERIGWHMTCFRDADQYPVSLGPAPSKVESVINHQVVNGRQIIVGVSGGVSLDPWKLVRRRSHDVESYGALSAERRNATAGELPIEAWWWD
jgi:hypothetical protein